MIAVDCYVCGRELNEPGALMFSPPDPEHDDRVAKVHLCVGCSWTVARALDDLRFEHRVDQP